MPVLKIIELEDRMPVLIQKASIGSYSQKIYCRVFFWEIAVNIPFQKTHSGKSNLQNYSENSIPETHSGKSNLRFPKCSIENDVTEKK